ncbi:lysylphosphatidylglycerol synthase transmembrane domain-containing protein [Shimia sp. R9_3]|uniref:lysylphosphatidylglycerol synthase transmembrane domain-containing protein n=1 Tax=Shimia sp. R9_3 TaxID=2821113 RepID=UPI001ADD21AF|nr:lysylphosphatidylglycerol synthase transmembrane domain-containing protein [Shimia sp. R9_3]MBO9403200.1 flippase-like domain-containing protein [Shimia sp. R9_3]
MSETPAGKGRLRAMISFLIKAVISIGLLTYLLYTQVDNMDEIWVAIGHADPAILLLAFSLNVFGYLLCSWRWQILLVAQKFDVPLMELIRAYTIGIFFNAFLPGLMSGDFMRAYDISDRVGSYTRSFLILFVERLTGMFGLLVLAALALPFVGRDIVAQTGVHWILLAVFVLLLIASTSLALMRKESRQTQTLSLPGTQKLQSIAGKIGETSRAFGSEMGAVYKCMGISFVFQANVVLHYYLIGVALGIEIPVWIYFGIIPISLFVMMIPASVNGIGIREQIFVYLFGAFGIGAAQAISLAWIGFGMVLLQAVAGGVIFAMRKRQRGTSEDPLVWSNASSQE